MTKRKMVTNKEFLSPLPVSKWFSFVDSGLVDIMSDDGFTKRVKNFPKIRVKKVKDGNIYRYVYRIKMVDKGRMIHICNNGGNPSKRPVTENKKAISIENSMWYIALGFQCCD